MNRLTIFTKLFPYAKTEAFLETEIVILSKYFDEIYICPAYSDSFVRSLPENVKLDNSFLVNKKFRFFCFLEAFFTGKLIKYYIDHKKIVKTRKDMFNIVRYSTYEIFFKKKLRKTTVELDNSIVYSYWFSHIVNSFIKIRLKDKNNFKIITRAHRWDVYEEGEAIFPYRSQTIENIDSIYCISKDAKTYIGDRYGYENKIQVSRLGVFDNNTISKCSTNEEFTFVSVSQITLRKRIFLLFESLCQYAKNNPEKMINWIHFGVGNKMDELHKLISKNNIKNIKCDLRGYVANKDIYKFYTIAKVDVFLNLSESEGVPVSIMEAQSFGIPVIATDVGGTSEIVEEDVGVLLNSSPTLDDVCNAIKLVNDKKIDRKYIKSKWNNKSNYTKNYKSFAESLLKL